MATLFVRHDVADFGAWKQAYDAFDAERKTMGVVGDGVYQAGEPALDGWTIQVFFPYGFILITVALFWIVACTAGIYPARLATRLNPKESVRAE